MYLYGTNILSEIFISFWHLHKGRSFIQYWHAINNPIWEWWHLVPNVVENDQKRNGDNTQGLVSAQGAAEGSNGRVVLSHYTI